MVILKKEGSPKTTQEDIDVKKRNRAIIGVVLLILIVIAIWKIQETYLMGYLVQHAEVDQVYAPVVAKMIGVVIGLVVFILATLGFTKTTSALEQQHIPYKLQKQKDKKLFARKKEIYKQIQSVKDRLHQKLSSLDRLKKEIIRYTGFKERFGKPQHHTTVLGKTIQKLKAEGLGEEKIRERLETSGWKQEAVDHYFKEEAKLAIQKELKANEQKTHFKQLKKVKQKEDVEAQQERFLANKKRASLITKEKQEHEKEEKHFTKAMYDSVKSQKKKDQEFEAKVDEVKEEVQQEPVKEDEFHFVGDSLDKENAHTEVIEVKRPPDYRSTVLMKRIRQLRSEGKNNKEIRKRLQLIGIWSEEMIEKHIEA